jgi:hypothetical protein
MEPSIVQGGSARILRTTEQAPDRSSGPREALISSQIGKLGFTGDAGMAIYLPLNLVLRHAVGFGQLADQNEGLVLVGDLADFRAKGDLLSDP